MVASEIDSDKPKTKKHQLYRRRPFKMVFSPTGSSQVHRCVTPPSLYGSKKSLLNYYYYISVAHTGAVSKLQVQYDVSPSSAR